MPEDFGYVWRTVRLYCPSAPTFLAREWANAAWKQLLGARRWGFLRTELLFSSDGVSKFVVMPPDFAMFEAVGDVDRKVKISFTGSTDQYTKIDPDLDAVGPPTALIAASPSEEPASLGQVRFRVYPLGAANFKAVYYRQGDRLTDGDVFTGVLADGAEVLVAGALAHAALWPGTPDKPNPYFNATLAQTKTNEFKLGVQMLSLRDDEQYPDDLWDSWPETCDCLGCGADPRSTDASALSY
jgi:hypothetical protein